MNIEILKRELTARWAGQPLSYKEETDSTNLDIVRLAEANAPHGTVALTERQSAGRGRKGRSWTSPAGENLYFSLLLRPGFPVEKASMVTLVMALAVAKALEAERFEPFIKWPNDIVLSGKKVCGILTELRMDQGGYYIIVGVGINVNQQKFPEEIKASATSLLLEKGELSREVLFAKILAAFEKYYEIFEDQKSFLPLKEVYEALLINKNKKVRVLDPKGEYEGIAKGISESGELLVEKENGTVEHVYAGEVSVRGIYGYV